MSSKDQKVLASGHTYEKISGDEYEQQARDFKAYKSGMIRLSPGGWFLPPNYVKYADRLYNFEFRPTDTVVMTYPKMGTTWTLEIIWTMLNNPDLNHPSAALIPNVRSPFMDRDMIFDNETLPPFDEKNLMYEPFQSLCPGKDPNDGVMVQMAEMMTGPRTLKTHLPLSLFKNDMLDKCKIVYVARNPKDGVISYLHHSRLINCYGYIGSTDQFIDYFMNEQLMYSPYWEHIYEAWLKRDHPNLHFMFFEDLKKDTEREIRKLAKFLDIHLTEHQFQNVLKYTSFESMKARDAVSGATSNKVDSDKESAVDINEEVEKKDGGFFRKGQTGSWKEKLSPENNAKIDVWTEKNDRGLGLKFKYT